MTGGEERFKGISFGTRVRKILRGSFQGGVMLGLRGTAREGLKVVLILGTSFDFLVQCFSLIVTVGLRGKVVKPRTGVDSCSKSAFQCLLSQIVQSGKFQSQKKTKYNE